MKYLFFSLLFLSCTPDPLHERIQREQYIYEQIIQHPNKKDSLRNELYKVWDVK
jgi:hypothetical protein